MGERIVPFREIVIATRAFTIRTLMNLRSTLQRLENKGWLEQADHPDGLAFKFTERGLKEVQSLR